MQYENETIYVKEEKIIKPGIVQQPNLFKKDLNSFLNVRSLKTGIAATILSPPLRKIGLSYI